ncbi:LysR substrate-binding domain-containing protein [Marinobacterium jannaschii]|uniref:LysR substrate-binding domain-containing protein n=1 Tax=Marinobacterium jannaschii TaxID=64970 RepID=UPI000481B7E0|nr:LysR substrate-binding domain-containing protein [Marinobacterium jannaschii]
MKLKAQTLAALKTFEAAARLRSFTDAAKELCVTTGAVSQQIRKLEESLGIELFVRRSRGIALTAQAQELLTVTQQSLQSIEKVIDSFSQQGSEEVRLKSTPSFVFKWLIPRLQAFHAEYPEIRVETFADAALLDLEAGDFDVAINYGFGSYPGFEAVRFMGESLIPVMSPDYQPEIDWQDSACWQQVNLLHDALPWPDAARDAEWRFWLDKSGLGAVNSASGHYFNRVDMAIAAASAGLGIALARRSLVEEELETGRLVAPLPAIESESSYYLLIPHAVRNSPSVQRLKNWLLKEAVRDPR